MPDAQMKSTSQGNGTTFPTWDFVVNSDGVVPFVDGEDARAQTATIAAYLMSGTVPQTDSIGVNWGGFLTGDVGFGELDGQIRQACVNCSVQDYSPDYSIKNGKLTVNMVKQ
jgi:hypothetical protein